MQTELLAIRTAYEDGGHDDVLALADAYVRRHGPSDEAQTRAALSLLQLERWEEAVYRSRLVGPGPFFSLALNIEVHALGRLHRVSEALSPARQAVQAQPDQPFPQLALSWVLLNQGDPSALPAAQRAVDLDPTSADARYALAMAQASVGRGWAARWSVRRALALDPEHAGARSLRQRLVFVFGFGRQGRAAQQLSDQIRERWDHAGSWGAESLLTHS